MHHHKHTGLALLAVGLSLYAASADAAGIRGGNEMSREGFVANMNVSGSAQVAGDTDYLGLGFGLAWTLGYELKIGPQHGFAPGIRFSYDRWGLKDNTAYFGVPITGAQSAIGVMFGGTYSYYFAKHLAFVAGAYLGFGRLNLGMEDRVGGTLDFTSTGFAFNSQLGLDIVAHRNLIIGLSIFDLTKIVVGSATSRVGTQQDIGSLSVNFGLHIKVKI